MTAEPDLAYREALNAAILGDDPEAWASRDALEALLTLTSAGSAPTTATTAR
jgi:hypothetical protein